jgi:GNAT superfamily N-acetyltransferase
MEMAKMAKFGILNRLPTIEEFKALRSAVGWIVPPAIARGLAGSVYGVCATFDDEVVGTGRIIGDGGFTYFLGDVIVVPALQRKGIGTAIMERLLAYIREDACVGAYVTLMAAGGKESFYERFGFVRRPLDSYGAGMMIPATTVISWLDAR